MDNEKNLQPEQDNAWFHELLDTPQEPQQELGLDESAIYAAGLIHPSDMELEKIISEAKAMDADQQLGSVEDVGSLKAAPIAADPYFHTPGTLAKEPINDEQYRQLFGQDTDLEAVVEQTDTQVIPDAQIDTQALPVADIESATTQDAKVEPDQAVEQKKGRPRMKKGYGLFGIPHILSTVVWAFIVVAVGVSFGRLLWVCASDVLAFGKNTKQAVITIQENDDLEDIANKLESAGLIEYPELFMLYMNFSGNDEIEVGVHHLTPMIYDYHAIKTAMAPRVAARDIIEVVIPEGYTCSQIFTLLEEKGVCSSAQLEDYAANGDLNEYWFLEGVQRGDKYCLEGYLFPDTYQFYKGHDPELVLEKMLDNFDYRFTDIMKEKISTLNSYLSAALGNRGYSSDYIEAHKFTIREVVIVASMIERETANGSESYDIASVIYNRLTNPGNYPFLNIDATVIYGMGGKKTDPATGESLPLTYDDLQADTPYNTYTRKGLIPGPIANPGRNSLNAALDPNSTEYYYYVYDPDAGRHKFARTEAEHEQNKASVAD